MRRIRTVTLRSTNSCKLCPATPHEFGFERFDQGHQQQGRPRSHWTDSLSSAAKPPDACKFDLG